MEGLNLETRRRIYGLIKETPGIHMRELQRVLSMPIGLLDYHLNEMEKHAIIASKMDRYYKRYYTTAIGGKDKEILSSLRQKSLRDILLFLILHSSSTHKRIMEELGIGPSTLSFYLKQLLDKQLIVKEKKGREHEYSVINKDEIVKLLITYRPSFIDKLVDSFLDVWFEDKGIKMP